MKIIVLGASGQIGSVIVEALNKHHNVIGTSRRSLPNYLQFDPFRDDWSKLGTVDALINCVGQIETTRTNSFYRIHVHLVKCILENRELIGNPKIIQISALGASADHKVHFLKTKGIADDLLLQQPHTTIVRPSIVCTHRTMLVRKMLMLLNISKYTGGLVFAPQKFLKTRIQPVMPQDLADVVHALCLNNVAQKIVNVVGPDRLSFHEIIAMLSEASKRKFRLVEISKVLSDLIVGYGVSAVFPKAINVQQYRLLFDDNIADPAEVKQILGRNPVSSKRFFYNEFSDATH